ncbi:MAG TPA: PIG-L family deacetylase [Saprospiraceae bacterium]|nr:PIG-L family deacetylase [Saprospiraceae bacterium]
MNAYRKITLILCLAVVITSVSAQAPKRYSSGDIYGMMEKLGVLGTVVYQAAHPDDENTSLIAYLANERKYDVYYLSMTRGDGGQNLIGPEIREGLGVIRTQELLAARRIDGGNQRFTRANDFGYSKNPQETFRIWGHDEILNDVIWAWRNVKPDVVINRFSNSTERPNHGHHTASAMLSVEAFDKVGDKHQFPKQLKYTSVWQPQRVFWNTSWWFYGSREAMEAAAKDKDLSQVDIGVYYPLRGLSNTEISAASRSMHKCQGFGVMGSRGEQDEYLELVKGDAPQGDDFMSGINTTWSRVPGGASIQPMVEALLKQFDPTNPAGSVSALLDLRQAIQRLPDHYYKTRKLTEIDRILSACMGLFLEATTGDDSGVPGTPVSLSIEAINRSNAPLILKGIEIQPNGADSTLSLQLKNNQDFTMNWNVDIPDELIATNPYWLNEEPLVGRYQVKDTMLIGLPETPHLFRVVFHMNLAGQDWAIEKTIVHKHRDPVKAEVYQPFEIIAPAYVNLQEPAVIFPDDHAKDIEVTVKAGAPNLSGNVGLSVPDGWRVDPVEQPFTIERKGGEARFKFLVTPPDHPVVDEVEAYVMIGEDRYARSWQQISYDHIPTQTVTQPSVARLVRMDAHRIGQRIAYIMGAGDEVPKYLEQLGYSITTISENQIDHNLLSNYDAAILGIRAYNTVDKLAFQMPELFQYVNNGGTLIVQYNTTSGLKVNEYGPYPLTLSHDRITEEDAKPQFLAPEHPVLNVPNQITMADFDGWVQERGLYFPSEWDKAYTPILRFKDSGDNNATDGALLVAPYGKGYFVYTGLSFFRELPAGVPGAYRLFANLIALGQEVRP